MTFDEFITKWAGKGCDYDNFYGFQCYDLAHQYATDVVGHDVPSAPGAKDLWNFDIEGYDKIANTPEGVPSKGDIVIWGTAIGAWGHVAIFVSGDQNNFTSFDQNWPSGSLCHLQPHNYTGVLGWFHPKDTNPQVSIQVSPDVNKITDQTKIDLGPQLGLLEVQAIRSELLDSRDKIGNQDLQIHSLQIQVKDLADKLIECQNPHTPFSPLAHDDVVANQNTEVFPPSEIVTKSADFNLIIDSIRGFFKAFKL